MARLRAAFPRCTTTLDADGTQCPNIADYRLISDNGKEYAICRSCGHAAQWVFGSHVIRLRPLR